MSLRTELDTVKKLLLSIESELKEKGTFMIDENIDEITLTLPEMYRGKNILIIYEDK